jgi:hypothetical protein
MILDSALELKDGDNEEKERKKKAWGQNQTGRTALLRY